MTITTAPGAVTVTSTVAANPPTTTITKSASLVAGPLNKKRQVTSPTGLVCPTTAVTPTYASACSGFARYSSACSCGGVRGTSVPTSTASTPTSTVVSTATSTVTVTQPAATVTSTTTQSQVTVTTTVGGASPTCGNAGLQFGWFAQPDYPYDPEVGYTWDPASPKSQTPAVTGVTQYLHQDTDFSVYGQPTNDYEYYAIEHRGYILALISGPYTFTVSNLDDIIYMWLGPQAYSGFSKGNANQEANYSPPTGQNGQNTYTVNLVANTYYPFRLNFRQVSSNNVECKPFAKNVLANQVDVQVTGPATFDYRITDPTGATLIGNSPGSSAAPNVVQYSCDGVAPQYPAFGQET